MKILVTGAHGFIGAALVRFFSDKGHEVLKVRRLPLNGATPAELLDPSCVLLDEKRGFLNPLLMEGCDVVLHFAGESIVGLWTEAKKERIRTSRIEQTARFCRTLAHLKNPPKLFIGASAVGFYGPIRAEPQTEEGTQGEGFLASLCASWEAQSQILERSSTRVVHLRMGMVCDLEGGALQQMVRLSRWGGGAIMGSKERKISWIALVDLMRMIEKIMQSSDIQGAVNATAPQCVLEGQRADAISRLTRRPLLFHCPERFLRFCLGEMAQELLLSDLFAQPQKMERSGFDYLYPIFSDFLFSTIETSDSAT